MPALYQDRVGISLYDAQWSTGVKSPIPSSVTSDVVRALLRFKSACRDFGVRDPENVRIVATEATRQAINSAEYRAEIEKATGWKVEMLPKEEEGRVGAMGVVSSFGSVKGLMMDLGGGSTQITWLIAKDGEVRMSEKGSVSMPYGAAALSRRLAEAQKLGGGSLSSLREEMTKNLKDAVEQIGIPKEIQDLASTPEGLPLYLSGGGFRGWGFVLMSQHPVQPYPIPIINGFKTTKANFYNVEMVKITASSDPNIFRVSERRASQVPAVALLVSCLLDALPSISTVNFAQGGVREGSIYSTLPPAIKSEHPLITATSPHRSPSSAELTTYVLEASSALEHTSTAGQSPPSIPQQQQLLTAFAQAMYVHNPMNKDIQAACALRSTTTGALASVHGADHEERALLAIMLCERWGGVGALAPGDEAFYRRLVELVGPVDGWWCMLFGRLGALLGQVYPAGVVRRRDKMALKLGWGTAGESGGDAGKKTSKKTAKDKQKRSGPDEPSVGTIEVQVDFGQDEEGVIRSMGVQKALKQLEKLGKKKNWPQAGKGGQKISLTVRSAAAGGEVDLPDEGLEHEFA